MKRSKQTKKALTGSVLALVLCFVMLLGTTFAWFTDTASTKVNTIQAGTLGVALLVDSGKTDTDGNVKWASAEGQELKFKNKEGGDEILWEPGATYDLPKLRISNNGNLALKYKVVISGIDGDAKLNEAIEWTMKTSGTAVDSQTPEEEPEEDNPVTYAVDGAAVTYSDLTGEYYLLPDESATLTISGKMKTDAGNEYQGLSIRGAAVTVYATQYTYEYDSNDNQYDAGANFNFAWDGTAATQVTKNKTDNCYHITSAAELAWLAQSVNAGNTYTGETFVLDTNIDLGNIAWTPIGIANHAANSYAAFMGTFDGRGYTISNLVVNTDYDAGLFGSTTSATIKNLTVDGAVVSGSNHTAVIVAHGLCAAVENCHVKNATVTGAVKNNDNGDKVGAIVGYLSAEPSASIKGCSATNCTITGYRDLGGIVGYANSGAEITGNKIDNVTIVVDKGSNYKNYAEDSAYDAGSIVGEGTANADNNTGTATINYVTATSTLPTTAVKGDVVLPDDISGAAKTDSVYSGTKAGFVLTDGTFDGNGNTLTVGLSDWGIQTSGGTIKNVTIKNAGRGIVINKPTEDVYIDNVTVTSCGYGINTAEHAAKSLYVTNSTIGGWSSWAGLASASFTNCSFGTSDYWKEQYSELYWHLLKPYVTTTFTNCAFEKTEKGYYLDLSALGTGCTVTLDNCTCDGVKLTKDNILTYVRVELSDSGLVQSVDGLPDYLIFK